jgi:uncharacterized protein YecT (DUF1311 family)/predicted small lipoprotein YifL
MMRQKITVLICMMMILICAGCGAKTDVQLQSTEKKTGSTEQQTDNRSGTEAQTADAGLYEGEYQTSADNRSESIQDELARIESASADYENADWGSMGQQDMNQLTAEWYKLWDDELNSLWSRLNDTLDDEAMASVLKEQREWLTRKDENIKGAGASVYGGSLQPQLENSVAEEMTRARAYLLAGYLADAKGEAFTIASDIQASIATADPDLDEVFEKFEGQWIFDMNRGACVGIERTKDCDYGIEGSEWTVWITGGDLISDLDVYGYTENSIVFHTSQPDFESFYILSFNVDNALIFEYGHSLDAMDDVIVCE